MKNFKQGPVTEAKSIKEFKGGSVVDFMARNLITITPDTDILDAIDLLVEHQISGAPVLNEKSEVIGMIDDKDCLRVLIDSFYHNLPVRGTPVTNYMDKVMKMISVDTDIVEIADIFLSSTYKRLLVVDENGDLVGQISRSDIVQAIKDLESI